MALLTQQMPPTTRQHTKRCDCCPYGYHIDLDFVRYCESIAELQYQPKKFFTSERRHGRKNRASMEILLGIPAAPTAPKAPDPPPIPPIRKDSREVLVSQASKDSGDGLEKAVLDFEETLLRSSQSPKKKGWAADEVYPEMRGEWLGGGLMRMGAPWKRRSLRRVSPALEKLTPEKEDVPFPPSSPDFHTTSNVPDSDGASVASNSSNISTSALQNVREQMAAGLAKTKELEEENKQIPVLKARLSSLSDEKHHLESRLKELEIKVKEAEEKVLQAKPKKEVGLNRRSVGVGMTIITRDVGVMKTMPYLVSRYTETDRFDPPEEKTQVTPPSPQKQGITTGTLTELRLNQIYTEDDLNKQIDQAIKVSETKIRSKKTFTMTCGSQTEEQRRPDKREMSIQVKPTTTDTGVTVQNLKRTLEYGCQVKPIVKDMGSSDHTVKDVSAEVRKISVGTSFPEKLPIPLSTRSRSFDQSIEKAKTLRSIGCGHERSMSTSKCTDTLDLHSKRDISVNTMKRKLVDAAVEVCQLPCQKCSGNALSSTPPKPNVSRIPRPTTLNVRTLNRQDTYTKMSPPHPSTKGLSNEEYNSDIESDEEARGPPNVSNSSGGAPMFQPIGSEPRDKKEPSKEMKAAMKVLNDSLSKSSGHLGSQMKNAVNIIQQEWFKVSSTSNANPLEVEDYLDCFEEYSSSLLEYIVNMVDVTGNTAMHYAVSHGNFDVVSILLDSKVCNINRPNAAGYTCIMLVSLAQVRSETHRQVVRRLFQMADVNIRAKQHGQTALMLAVSHGRTDTVELLLESGADINIQDEDGSTALMCAAEHGHIDIVKLLLSQPDCDVTITDYDGSTALNIAMEAGNRDVGVLLYAQEHFNARGSSPYTSLKHKRSKSSTPTLKTPPPRTPTSPHPSKKKSSDTPV